MYRRKDLLFILIVQAALTLVLSSAKPIRGAGDMEPYPLIPHSVMTNRLNAY